jgi:membrane protein DedA with SNARE-associated domain
MEEQIVSFLENLSTSIPIPLFAFLGSVLEEVVAPIPSPFVPITTGSLTYEQQLGFMFLFFVAFIGSIGKTLSTLFTYWISDKFEDFLTHSTIGRVLGVDEAEVEKYGRYLNGTRRDSIIMLLLRTLPFIPTLPVSVIAGLIKLNIWTYTWTTFVGVYLRYMFFSVLAYEGLRKYSGLLEILDTTGSLVKVLIITTFAGWLFFFLRKRWDRIVDFVLRRKHVDEIVKTSVEETNQQEQK